MYIYIYIYTYILHVCITTEVVTGDRRRVGLEAHASMGNTLVGPLWEGYHESRRCSRDTYPETHITKYAKVVCH